MIILTLYYGIKTEDHQKVKDKDLHEILENALLHLDKGNLIDKVEERYNYTKAIDKRNET